MRFKSVNTRKGDHLSDLFAKGVLSRHCLRSGNADTTSAEKVGDFLHSDCGILDVRRREPAGLICQQKRNDCCVVANCFCHRSASLSRSRLRLREHHPWIDRENTDVRVPRKFGELQQPHAKECILEIVAVADINEIDTSCLHEPRSADQLGCERHRDAGAIAHFEERILGCDCRWYRSNSAGLIVTSAIHISKSR